ncbi:MAG: divergent polysaccharide deacetylase family protein [Alphaproteobacteria bacterium]|nr:divergent polysaccharide deacetylase family protein [Alphaproteobacteria bacterium]
MSKRFVFIMLGVIFSGMISGLGLGVFLVDSTDQTKVDDIALTSKTEKQPSKYNNQFMGTTSNTVSQKPDFDSSSNLDNDINTSNEPLEYDLIQEGSNIKEVMPQSSQEKATAKAVTTTNNTNWLRHALAFDLEAVKDKAKIAIVIDDVGVAQNWTKKAVKLPAPMTMSFIPYGTRLDEHIKHARENGHEIMLHLPMEAMSKDANPGENALLEELDTIELVDRLLWNLDKFDGYVAVNNHMGSKFTKNREKMQLVMNELKLRDVGFVDSITTSDSVGYILAQSMNIPSAVRNFFIDNDKDEAAIMSQLSKVEKYAEENGFVLAIGHPYKETTQALEKWVANLNRDKFVLVPASAIIKLSEESRKRPVDDNS